MALTFTTGTQETFDSVGIRETLSDLIYNISPTETPFLMMAGRDSTDGTKVEWQMDDLSAAVNNADHEGKKVDAVLTVGKTLRVANHCSISSKAISVSGTNEVVNKAGRSSELSYQLAKRSKELKRDMEKMCVGAITQASVGANDGTARQLSSVQAFYHAKMDGQAAARPYESAGAHISRNLSTDGGWDTAATVHDPPGEGSAVQRALLESDLKGVIQGAWTNGGDPTIIMVGPFNKTVISGFTGNSTRFDRGEDKRLVAAIDVYVSDFGEHRVVPNRFQRGRDCFGFTPELSSICYLRPFRQHALAKIGDAEERQLLVEWTLKFYNQGANALVADLTTS